MTIWLKFIIRIIAMRIYMFSSLKTHNFVRSHNSMRSADCTYAFAPPLYLWSFLRNCILFFINSLSLALCGCCGSGFGLAYLCLVSVSSVFLLVLVKRQIDIAFHNGNHFCWKILRNFVATNALNKMARKRLRTRLVSESYRNLSRIHCF